MDKQIKDIINKYQFDQKTRTYSNKHYFKNNSIYASVHSNDDVERLLEGVNAYFGHIRTLIPGTSGRCFGIIRTAFRLIRTPCRVN